MREEAAIRLERLLLALVVLPALAAFGAAYDQPLAWGFALPCAVAAFWQVPRVPKWLGVGLLGGSYLFELLAVILGFIFMAYPILSMQTATRYSLIAGYGLCAFASLFLLGMRAWKSSTALWPAVFGLLIVDCFNPDAKIRPLLVGPGLAAVAYLALPVLGRSLRQVPRARWGRLAAFTALSATIAAALIVGTPQVQTETEKMRFDFAASHMPAYTGLSGTTRLGDLEQLKLSQAIVMRVWTDHPQYLRARAYLRFDGREWISSPGFATPLESSASGSTLDASLRDWLQEVPGTTFTVPGADVHATPEPLVHTRIVQKLFNNGMMVSPGGKLLVKAELPGLRLDPQDNLVPPAAGGAEIYAILSRNQGNVVRRAPAGAAEMSEALQFPTDTDARIRDLAARLASGTRSPEEKLNRTLAYLQDGYRYTLKVGSFHSAQPVAEFLFEKKAGYCQYFASAAALLLRIEGIPARYVSGFHLTEDNRSGDHYVVRELDAHAWIEAYIPSKGWVTADPTPAAEYESLHAGLSRGWLSDAWEAIRAKTAEMLARVTVADWRGTLSWIWRQIKASAHWLFHTPAGWVIWMVFLLGWGARRFHDRRPAIGKSGETKSLSTAQTENASELARLLERLDLYWKKQGFARPAHRTPLEHLETIPEEKLAIETRRLAREIVESYYRASLGGRPASHEEIRRLQNELEPVLKDR